MNFTKPAIAILAVVLFGMGFSSYLTAGVLLANACPLYGGCVLVLGYPSCMYGFAMYTIMLIILLLTWREKIGFATGRKLILLVAVVGMLFSGSLLIKEFLNRSPLTICAAGFSMFTLIFFLSLLAWKKEWSQRSR
jgi:uncharacterized membrane protein